MPSGAHAALRAMLILAGVVALFALPAPTQGVPGGSTSDQGAAPSLELPSALDDMPPPSPAPAPAPGAPAPAPSAPPPAGGAPAPGPAPSSVFAPTTPPPDTDPAAAPAEAQPPPETPAPHEEAPISEPDEEQAEEDDRLSLPLDAEAPMRELDLVGTRVRPIDPLRALLG